MRRLTARRAEAAATRGFESVWRRFFSAFGFALRSMALALALGAAVWANASRAQSDPDAGFETLPASAVLIVNVEQIYRDSAAGRSIAATEEALISETETELARRRALLRAESEALTAARETTPPDEFELRTEAFRRDVAALRRYRRERALAIQRAVAAARARLTQELQPVLVGLMRERRAAVMIDARNVVFSASALDITEEAIKRLDEAVPSIEVRVDASEE